MLMTKEIANDYLHYINHAYNAYCSMKWAMEYLNNDVESNELLTLKLAIGNLEYLFPDFKTEFDKAKR